MADTQKEPRSKTLAVEVAFTKEQFLGSQQFTNIEKDFLAALLQENRGYTISEARKLLADYKSKEAK